MRTLLPLLLAAALLALTACADDPAQSTSPAPADPAVTDPTSPTAGTVHITCADIVNQGQASACAATASATAAPVDGGTISRGQPVEITTEVTNGTAAQVLLVTVTFGQVSRNPDPTVPYVIGVGINPLDAGASVLTGGGFSDGGAPLGASTAIVAAYVAADQAAALVFENYSGTIDDIPDTPVDTATLTYTMEP